MIAGDIRVLMPGGYKIIDDIKVGELIFTYDEDMNLGIRRVTYSAYTGLRECFSVRWRGGQNNFGYLVATREHRLRLIDGTWRRIDELEVDDRVLSAGYYNFEGQRYLRMNGKRTMMAIANHWIVQVARTAKVYTYNLEVDMPEEETSNFIASEICVRSGG